MKFGPFFLSKKLDPNFSVTFVDKKKPSDGRSFVIIDDLSPALKKKKQMQAHALFF
jgi:hypothetical protein